MIAILNPPPSGAVNHVADASTTHGRTQSAAGKSRFWRSSLLAALFVAMPFMPRAQSQTGPALTVSANSVAFGNVPLETAAAPQTVTLKSSGTTALKITAGAVAGPAAFKMSGATFPMTLNPGETATLTLGFDAGAAGAKSGLVVLTTNASPSKTLISLSGTAVAAGLTLSTSTVNFGDNPVGTAATPQTVTLTSSGSVPLTINAATVGAPAAFSVSLPSFPMTLSPGQSATLTVGFDPGAAGAKSGTITLISNASTAKTTIALSGTAGNGTPGLTLSTVSVAFGDVTLNTSATQEVVVTSSGTAPLVLSAGQATGTGFSVSGVSFPVSLNPGQTATLEVAFDPTTANPEIGDVALTTNTPSGTATVALTGTGETPSTSVNMNWQAPTDSSDAAMGYNVYRAVGASSVFVQINSSANQTTSYTDNTVTSGTAYTYYVKSLDAMGNESAPSNPFTVTVP